MSMCICQQSSYRDLVQGSYQETFYGDLVQRPGQESRDFEVLYRDIAYRSVEILPRGLTLRATQLRSLWVKSLQLRGSSSVPHHKLQWMSTLLFLICLIFLWFLKAHCLGSLAGKCFSYSYPWWVLCSGGLTRRNHFPSSVSMNELLHLHFCSFPGWKPPRQLGARKMGHLLAEVMFGGIALLYLFFDVRLDVPAETSPISTKVVDGTPWPATGSSCIEVWW